MNGSQTGIGKRLGDLKRRFVATPLPFKLGFGAAATALALAGTAAVIPVAAGLGGLGLWYRYVRKPAKYSACMTPERVKVYEQAIETLKDPKKLRILADEFERAGCAQEAEHLKKRAGLRERSKEEQASDRKLYRDTMQSNDPRKVAEVAEHFKRIGADGAAKHLKIRERTLRELLKAKAA